MHLVDFTWTFACSYYDSFVIEAKFNFNTQSRMDFCIGEFLSGFIFLIRNIAYTIVATSVMYYGSTYLNEFLYILMILLATNLVVFFDCFVISNLFDCGHTFTNLATVNPVLYD